MSGIPTKHYHQIDSAEISAHFCVLIIGKYCVQYVICKELFMTAIHIDPKCKKIHQSRLIAGWQLLFVSIAMNLLPKDEISGLYQHTIIIYFQVLW
jgi:hypothetical protein